MHTQQRSVSFGPLVGLFFTAPLIAEYLLGDVGLKQLGALLILAPLYGGGALLIRELARRLGRGWPSILLLGMAYGIVEEAYTTQSLFNPNYLHLNLGLLAPAFIPRLGISAWWTLFMLLTHSIWSIATPIALVEACVPDRARTPWSGRFGLPIIAVVYLVGIVVNTVVGYRMDHYIASKVQFASAAAFVVMFVIAAFAIPNAPRRATRESAASAWLLGAIALVFASGVLVTPNRWGWGAVAAHLALACGMLLVVAVWRRKGALSLPHQLALGAGAAVAYGWHAFTMPPLFGKSDAIIIFGHVVFLGGVFALVVFAATRIRAQHASESV